MTTVSKLMTRQVRTLAPSDSVATAAQLMDELDVGVIPVCEAGKLLGVVTDRDIVIRTVARGLSAGSTQLSAVMSTGVRTARETDDVDETLEEMAEHQVRRLPVVDDEDRLIGIISIGDIAANGVDEEADVGQSLGAISSPD